MSALSETIAREYFEHHGFLVSQERKYISHVRREDEEIDFLVVNSAYEPAKTALPFELRTRDLVHVGRAVVVVKGWHSETFSPSLLVTSPELFRFLEPAALKQREQVFPHHGPLRKIMVLPALPATDELRQASIEFLQSKGLDGVIPFRLMLQDLIDGVQANRNYQKSDLLQILRILKINEFFREPQLDLFNAPRRRRAKKKPSAAGES